MTDYDSLARVKMDGYAQSAGVNKSIVRLREVNINNYPQVIQQDENGYTLFFNGKSQYSQWRIKGDKKMTDYNQFDDAVKAKKAASKFLSIEIGESAEYEFAGMKLVNQINNFSHDEETVWLVSLKGIDPKLPEERKNWTVSSVKVFEQFKNQDINEGDRILISREPKGDKSTYIVKKLGGK